MNPLSSPAIRIALNHGAAHFSDSVLSFRRFGSGVRGGAKFLVRGDKPIAALLALVAELAKSKVGGQPEMRPLGEDYVAYWTPPETLDAAVASSWSVTLSLEPLGRPGKSAPFTIELRELCRIEAKIRNVRS